MKRRTLAVDVAYRAAKGDAPERHVARSWFGKSTSRHYDAALSYDDNAGRAGAEHAMSHMRAAYGPCSLLSVQVHKGHGKSMVAIVTVEVAS